MSRTNRYDPPGPSMVLFQPVPQEISFRGDLGWCWQHPLEATCDEVGVPGAANRCGKALLAAGSVPYDHARRQPGAPIRTKTTIRRRFQHTAELTDLFWMPR